MIRALIIDDEKPAREVMRELLTAYTPEVELVGECANVPDAVLAIKKLKPDVVFLDIEMPNYSGFELLSFFDKVDFEIIFVTAYSEYALKAFEVSAVDYVLKPVRISLLKKAVANLKVRLDAQSMQARLDALKENMEQEKLRKIAIPQADGVQFIYINDISHIEAQRSYAKIYKQDGSSLMTSKPLSYYAEIIDDQENFLRVHRSFFINLNLVASYLKGSNKLIMENELEVNIARDRKAEVEAILLKSKA
jgi:two-component system LytT family response regulator